MTHSTRTRACCLFAALAILWPSLHAWAQSSDPEAQREGIRQRQADLASELDVLRASDKEISEALTTLNQNVAAQIDRLAAARAAAAEARAAEAAAEAQVASASQQVATLAERVRQMAVGLYVRPPLDDVVTAVVNANPNDAPERFALARFRVEDVADTLRLSREAKTRLEAAQRQAELASLEADQRSFAEQARLDELESARAQQQAFAQQVSERIERALGEAGQLEVMDSELTAQIQRQQLELAARLKTSSNSGPGAGASLQPAAPPQGGAAQGEGGSPTTEAPSPGTTSPPPQEPGPTATTVPETPTTPPTTAPPATTAPRAPTTTAPRRVIEITPVETVWVGGIEVAASIGPQLQALLDAARQAGLVLTGSGYRNILDQIEIRRQVCGPTDYDIYDKPSWECSPPVARPGFSMHEKGLAVDFTGNDGDLVRTRDSPAFKWLQANAGRFGFYNLPSEPWHWSVNGR